MPVLPRSRCENGNLKLVETTQAKGTDQRPGRNLEYGANQLSVEFNDNNQIQKITGVDQARVVSNGETSQTTITSDRVVMDFDTTGSDSILQTAVAQGHSTMESKPVIKPGVDPAETRVLKSDTIHTKMRAGGQEIEAVETDGPGAIEFIPNRAEQPHRWMNGDHIWMTYGPKNTIQSFRSVAATTRTEKPKAKGRQRSARAGAHLEQESGCHLPAQFVAAGQPRSIRRFSLSGRRSPRQGRARVARPAQQHHQFDRRRTHVGLHRFGRCRQDRDESNVGRFHRRRACHFHAPARIRRRTIPAEAEFRQVLSSIPKTLDGVRLSGALRLSDQSPALNDVLPTFRDITCFDVATARLQTLRGWFTTRGIRAATGNSCHRVKRGPVFATAPCTRRHGEAARAGRGTPSRQTIPVPCCLPRVPQPASEAPG